MDNDFVSSLSHMVNYFGVGLTWMAYIIKTLGTTQRVMVTKDLSSLKMTGRNREATSCQKMGISLTSA